MIKAKILCPIHQLTQCVPIENGIMCEKCFNKSQPKKILISKKQYEKLKKGSVLLSLGGRRRIVLSKTEYGYIKLRKLGYSKIPFDYVGYLYSDICRKYKILKY